MESMHVPGVPCAFATIAYRGMVMNARWLALALLLCLGACTGDTSPSTNGVVPFAAHPLDDPERPPDLTQDQAALIPRLFEVPRRVRLGDDLRYVVELRNQTDEDISLDPCPAFYQAWGESAIGYFGSGLLNCADAPPAVPARAGVRFEMKLDLPNDFDGQNFFAGTIVWYLGGSGADSEAVHSRTVVVSKGGCLAVVREGGDLKDLCS
jgi:hypothetical protein